MRTREPAIQNSTSEPTNDKEGASVGADAEKEATGLGTGEREASREEVLCFYSLVSARRHAVSGELIGAGNEVRDRGILITESNQFHETRLATPRNSKEQSTLSCTPIPSSLRYFLLRASQRSNQMHRIKLI